MKKVDVWKKVSNITGYGVDIIAIVLTFFREYVDRYYYIPYCNWGYGSCYVPTFRIYEIYFKK